MKNKYKPNPENIITLCKQCADDYYNSPDFRIKAIQPRIFKEKCTKCDRGGFDYEVTPKYKRRGRK
jgi:hypothetical protein